MRPTSVSHDSADSDDCLLDDAGGQVRAVVGGSATSSPSGKYGGVSTADDDGGGGIGSQAPEFKVCIVGDAGVGKSSLLVRYADNRFVDAHTPTIGVDLKTVNLTVDWRDGPQKIKLRLWDTAGQERFQVISRQYYHEAAGALVVYDVTKKETFLNVPKWTKALRDVAGDIPVLVIANKSDLLDEEGQEDIGSADELPSRDSVSSRPDADADALTTSAKTGDGVDRAFAALGRSLLDARSRRAAERPGTEGSLRLGGGKGGTAAKGRVKKCC